MARQVDPRGTYRDASDAGRKGAPRQPLSAVGQPLAAALEQGPEGGKERLRATSPGRNTELCADTLERHLGVAAAGQLFFRYSTPLPHAPEGTECDAGALEIPVQVSIQSSALALHEMQAAVLKARVPYRAELGAVFEPRGLAGALMVSELYSLDPERKFWPKALNLTATLWPGGSRGALELEIGTTHTNAKTPIPLAADLQAYLQGLAIWPCAASCESGAALPRSAADPLDPRRFVLPCFGLRLSSIRLSSL